MSGRLRTRVRLFIQKSLESGVVIAGGERLFDFPSLHGGKFWPARPAEARARRRLGLAEIIGLTPRLQRENEAVTAIRGHEGQRRKTIVLTFLCR